MSTDQRHASTAAFQPRLFRQEKKNLFTRHVIQREYMASVSVFPFPAPRLHRFKPRKPARLTSLQRIEFSNKNILLTRSLPVYVFSFFKFLKISFVTTQAQRSFLHTLTYIYTVYILIYQRGFQLRCELKVHDHVEGTLHVSLSGGMKFEEFGKVLQHHVTTPEQVAGSKGVGGRKNIRACTGTEVWAGDMALCVRSRALLMVRRRCMNR